MGRPPLGQHFLTTAAPARALVRALDLRPEDTVIEIGPGHGELTRFLAEAPHARLICIERDVVLAASVVRRFAGDPRVEVVHGDVREILAPTVAALPPGPWKLAGNIPYYLTSYLIRLVGDLPRLPERAALLMQEEVAERVAAAPGRFTKLAAFAGAWATSTIAARVPRTSFSPPPKVDSAVLSFIRRGEPVRDRAAYDAFVRNAFAQPRKVLLNNVATGGIAREAAARIIEEAGLPKTVRPQDLTVELIERLAPLFRGG